MLAALAPFTLPAYTVGGAASLRVQPRFAAATMQAAAPAPAKVSDELKTVSLKNAKGDTATVYQFGACVTAQSRILIVAKLSCTPSRTFLGRWRRAVQTSRRFTFARSGYQGQPARWVVAPLSL